MAEHEPLLSDPQTPETAAHVEDYSTFTKLVKWGAIGSAILIVLAIWLIT